MRGDSVAQPDVRERHLPSRRKRLGRTHDSPVAESDVHRRDHAPVDPLGRPAFLETRPTAGPTPPPRGRLLLVVGRAVITISG
jgi:hypothetical protein